MTGTPIIVGRWRVTGMCTWDNDYIDLAEPGATTFAIRNTGKMAFGDVTANLDCAFDKAKCDAASTLMAPTKAIRSQERAGPKCPAPTPSRARPSSTTATTRLLGVADGDQSFSSSLLASLRIDQIVVARISGTRFEMAGTH